MKFTANNNSMLHKGLFHLGVLLCSIIVVWAVEQYSYRHALIIYIGIDFSLLIKIVMTICGYFETTMEKHCKYSMLIAFIVMFAIALVGELL